MRCPKCEADAGETASFCPRCGCPLHPETTDRPGGPEAPEIRLRGLFSDVLRRHTDEEAERFFAVGTTRTTPDITQVADTWPRPWLFARVLIAVLLIYLGFYIGLVYFGNLNFLPGLIIVGAIAAPVSLLIFFWEINVPQNVSFYRVLIVFTVGGITSLLFSVLLYAVVGYAFDSGAGTILIGLVEESAKVGAILLFVRNRRYPYILNGLLIGAAVGAGFATFETAGYILQSGRELFRTILLRAILAPGGHIAWAALTGAAIYRIRGTEDFRMDMLRDAQFIRIFLIVVALHALWDSDLPPLIPTVLPVYPLIYTLISWVLVFAFIRAGLRQIAGRRRIPLDKRRPSL